MEQTARHREAKMLRRCAQVACGPSGSDATDGREANVFRVAAMVLQSSFPAESKRLKEAAERYFAHSPEELTRVVDVVRNGDVISLPRLRDSLSWLLRHTGMH